MVLALSARLTKCVHKDLLNDFLHVFPENFQNKIKSYQYWGDAQASLLGRLLLNIGSKKYGVEEPHSKILYNSYGKPYFINTPIHFNISHSGDLVICVITTEAEIGVDLEKRKLINLDDFKLHLTKKEWQTIKESEDRLALFYEFWTKKEAVVKAYGTGLSFPLNSFSVESDFTVLNGMLFYLKSIYLTQDYDCSIASKIYIPGEDIHLMKLEMSELYQQNFYDPASQLPSNICPF